MHREKKKHGMGPKRDQRERERENRGKKDNGIPAEHRCVEGGISMMNLERIYIYIYLHNKLLNFNKPTLLGVGRDRGNRPKGA